MYVAVLASKNPEYLPSVMAYLLTILRAQQEYEDPPWRVYDESFRDMAASTGLKDWSKPDEAETPPRPGRGHPSGSPELCVL